MNTAIPFHRVTTTRLLKVSGVLALITGAYIAASWLDVGEFLHPDRLDVWLQSAGPFGPILFILLMATTVVITPLPSLPLDLAAGAVFGLLPGTAYAVIGAEIGAILSFLIARAVGREALSRIFRTEISFCERCSDRHLVFLVFLARFFPIFSFDLVSYGAGLTNMSLRAFAMATLMGMIIPTFALTYTGRSLVAAEWLVMLLGLVLVIFFLLIPKLVIRHQSSRWVRLLQGEVPAGNDRGSQQNGAEQPVSAPAHRCSSCGGLME